MVIRKIKLQPEQIIVPGEYELGDESILKIYFRIFAKGHGAVLPPVLVAKSIIEPGDLSPALQYKIIMKSRKKAKEDFDTVDAALRQGEWRKTDKGIEYLVRDVKTIMLIKVNLPFGFLVVQDDALVVPQEDVNQCEKLLEATEHHSYRCFVEEMVKYDALLGKARMLRAQGAKYILLDGNHRTAAAALAHQPIYALELLSDDDLENVRLLVEQGELLGFKREEKSLQTLICEFYTFCKERVDTFNTVKERIDELVKNKDVPEYMAEYYIAQNKIS